jgi:hypothetical protein
MPSETNIQVNVSLNTVEKCKYCPDVPPGNYCDECGKKKPKRRTRSPLAEQSPINPDQAARTQAARTIRELIQRRRAEQDQTLRTQPIPLWPLQPQYDPPQEVEEADSDNNPLRPFYTTTISSGTTSSPSTGPTYPFLPSNESEPPF